MKKTYYLFNPGRLSRKDKTLKFTPVDEEGNEQQPKYLPVEAIEDMYVFGSLDANSALYTFNRTSVECYILLFLTLRL